jgi:hypothetical protein
MKKMVGRSSLVSDVVSRVVNWANSSNPLTTAGEIFFHRMANPCGEVTSPVRGVDAALQTSAAFDLRGVATPTPTWLNEQQIDASLRNWAMYLVIPPLMKTVCYILASRNNSDPTRQKQAEIWSVINESTEDDMKWPAWIDIDGDWIATQIEYDGINYEVDPVSVQSKVFQSMRWLGNGIVVEHNCPRFYDQGTVVAAQFPTDSKEIEIGTTRLTFQAVVKTKSSNWTAADRTGAFPLTVELRGTDVNGEVFKIGSVEIASDGDSGTMVHNWCFMGCWFPTTRGPSDRLFRHV